jgi:hypothetical protein
MDTHEICKYIWGIKHVNSISSEKSDRVIHTGLFEGERVFQMAIIQGYFNDSIRDIIKMTKVKKKWRKYYKVFHIA